MTCLSSQCHPNLTITEIRPLIIISGLDELLVYYRTGLGPHTHTKTLPGTRQLIMRRHSEKTVSKGGEGNVHVGDSSWDQEPVPGTDVPHHPASACIP